MIHFIKLVDSMSIFLIVLMILDQKSCIVLCTMFKYWSKGIFGECTALVDQCPFWVANIIKVPYPFFNKFIFFWHWQYSKICSWQQVQCSICNYLQRFFCYCMIQEAPLLLCSPPIFCDISSVIFEAGKCWICAHCHLAWEQQSLPMPW